MKSTKSQMSKDFHTKSLLRDCHMANGGYMHKTSRYNQTDVSGAPGMADGGLVGNAADALRGRAKTIDDAEMAAVKGPAPKPSAAPARETGPSEPDDSAIGIHIPKPVRVAPPPAKKGLLGLGFMGLRDGGYIDDGEEPEVMRSVPQNPKTFANGGLADDPDARRAQMMGWSTTPTAPTPVAAAAPAPVAAASTPTTGSSARSTFASSSAAAPTVGESLRAGFINDATTDIGWNRMAEQQSARGGYPTTFATGGPVVGPGGPTDDKVPAMLSHGEYVLPADTVKAVGRGKLDALRSATHTPVKMAGGGMYDDYVNSSNANAAAGSPFGQAAVTPGSPDTLDARDLTAQNQANGQYVRATAATVPTGAAGDMDARDLKVQQLRSPQLAMPGSGNSGPSEADIMSPQGPPGTDGKIIRTGNTYYGSGPDTGPDHTIDNANAAAKAQMDAMDAKTNQGYADQRQGLYNASMQNQAAYDQRQKDAAFQTALRDPNLTKSAKSRLLQAREQDIQQQANQANKAVMMRGQDLSAATTTRGQDIGANTAAAEQGVQTRGQNLTYQTNVGLRNLQIAQMQRSQFNANREYGLQQGRMGLDQQRLGLDQAKNQRDAQQVGLNNLTSAVRQANTTNSAVTGSAQVNEPNVASTMDKIAYTAQQMGIHPGDIPPELQQELIRRASEANDREDAAKGITGWLSQRMGLAVNQSTRDLRKLNPTGFTPGAVVDTVNTPTGPITRRDYEYGGPSKSGYLNFDALPNQERRQDLEGMMQKLRSPR